MSAALEAARLSPLPGELRAKPRQWPSVQEPEVNRPRTPCLGQIPQQRTRRRRRGLLAAGAAAALLLATAVPFAIWQGTQDEEPAQVSALLEALSCSQNCSTSEVLAAARKQAKQLRAERDQLASRLDLLSKTAGEAEGLRAQLRQRQAEAASAVKRAQEAEESVSRLQKQLQAARSALADSRGELKELERAHAELRRLAEEAASSEERLSAVSSELQAVKEALQQAHGAQEAQKVADAKVELCHRRLTDSQALIKALSGRTDSCWQAAERAKERAWQWQLRSATASAVAVLVCSTLALSYRRWMRRQVWRLTTEKGRLSAALRLAQTGVAERLQGDRRRQNTTTGRGGNLCGGHHQHKGLSHLEMLRAQGMSAEEIPNKSDGGQQALADPKTKKEELQERLDALNEQLSNVQRRIVERKEELQQKQQLAAQMRYDADVARYFADKAAAKLKHKEKERDERLAKQRAALERKRALLER